ISLSDENDCSVIDTGLAYLTLASTHILRGGTSVCKNNPNDPCCINCGQQAPTGCPSPASDPACASSLNDDNDPIALRCFDQKRKFGIDFLFPISRYVAGLTQPTIYSREGLQVPNPLFTDNQCGGVNCKPARDPRQVFFATI